MSSVAPPDQWDKVVLVIDKVDGEERRRKMTLREAYAEIDFSTQHSLCKNCSHDIDEHETTKDYKTKFAGKCTRILFCSCDQYIPGEVKTEKEIRGISDN